METGDDKLKKLFQDFSTTEQYKKSPYKTFQEFESAFNGDAKKRDELYFHISKEYDWPQDEFVTLYNEQTELLKKKGQAKPLVQDSGKPAKGSSQSPLPSTSTTTIIPGTQPWPGTAVAPKKKEAILTKLREPALTPGKVKTLQDFNEVYSTVYNEPEFQGKEATPDQKAQQILNMVADNVARVNDVPDLKKVIADKTSRELGYVEAAKIPEEVQSQEAKKEFDNWINSEKGASIYNKIKQPLEKKAQQAVNMLQEGVKTGKITVEQAKKSLAEINKEMNSQITAGINSEWDKEFNANVKSNLETKFGEIQSERYKQAVAKDMLLSRRALYTIKSIANSENFKAMNFPDKKRVIAASWDATRVALEKRGYDRNFIEKYKEQYMSEFVYSASRTPKGDVTSYGVRDWAKDALKDVEEAKNEVKTKLDAKEAARQVNLGVDERAGELMMSGGLSGLMEGEDPLKQDSLKQDYAVLQQAEAQILSTLARPELGGGNFGEGLTQGFKFGHNYPVPYVKSAIELSNNLNIYRINQKVKAGKELNEGEKLLLHSLGMDNAYQQDAKPSFGYHVGEASTISLPYMADMAAGNWAAAPARTAVKAGILKLAPKMAGNMAFKYGVAQPISVIVGELARTAANPLAWSSAFVAHMNPEVQFAFGSDVDTKKIKDNGGDVVSIDEMVAILDRSTRDMLGQKTGKGMDPMEAFAYAFLDNFKENLSEQLGGALGGELGEQIIKTLAKNNEWAKRLIISSMLRKNGGLTPTSFQKTIKELKDATAFNGLVPENFEEYAAALGEDFMYDRPVGMSITEDFAKETLAVTAALQIPMQALGLGAKYIAGKDKTYKMNYRKQDGEMAEVEIPMEIAMSAFGPKGKVSSAEWLYKELGKTNLTPEQRQAVFQNVQSKMYWDEVKVQANKMFSSKFDALNEDKQNQVKEKAFEVVKPFLQTKDEMLLNSLKRNKKEDNNIEEEKPEDKSGSGPGNVPPVAPPTTPPTTPPSGSGPEGAPPPLTSDDDEVPVIDDEDPEQALNDIAGKIQQKLDLTPEEMALFSQNEQWFKDVFEGTGVELPVEKAGALSGLGQDMDEDYQAAMNQYRDAFLEDIGITLDEFNKMSSTDKAKVEKSYQKYLQDIQDIGEEEYLKPKKKKPKTPFIPSNEEEYLATELEGVRLKMGQLYTMFGKDFFDTGKKGQPYAINWGTSKANGMELDVLAKSLSENKKSIFYGKDQQDIAQAIGDFIVANPGGAASFINQKIKEREINQGVDRDLLENPDLINQIDDMVSQFSDEEIEEMELWLGDKENLDSVEQAIDEWLSGDPFSDFGEFANYFVGKFNIEDIAVKQPALAKKVKQLIDETRRKKQGQGASDSKGKSGDEVETDGDGKGKEKKPEEVVAKEYRYELRNRPFQIGTYPKEDSFLRFEQTDGSKFGYVVYSEKLPQEKWLSFELAPETEIEEATKGKVFQNEYYNKIVAVPRAGNTNFVDVTQSEPKDGSDFSETITLTAKDFFTNIKEGYFKPAPQAGSVGVGGEVVDAKNLANKDLEGLDLDDFDMGDLDALMEADLFGNDNSPKGKSDFRKDYENLLASAKKELKDAETEISKTRAEAKSRGIEGSTLEQVLRPKLARYQMALKQLDIVRNQEGNVQKGEESQQTLFEGNVSDFLKKDLTTEQLQVGKKFITQFFDKGVYDFPKIAAIIKAKAGDQSLYGALPALVKVYMAETGSVDDDIADKMSSRGEVRSYVENFIVGFKEDNAIKPLPDNVEMHGSVKVMREIAAKRPDLKPMFDEGEKVFNEMMAIREKAGNPDDMFIGPKASPKLPFPFRLQTSLFSGNRSTDEKRAQDIADFQKEVNEGREYLKNPPSDEELAAMKTENDAKRKAKEEATNEAINKAKERLAAKEAMYLKEKEFIDELNPNRKPTFDNEIEGLLLDGVSKETIRKIKDLADALTAQGEKTSLTQANELLSRFKYRITNYIQALRTAEGDLFDIPARENFIPILQSIADKYNEQSDNGKGGQNNSPSDPEGSENDGNDSGANQPDGGEGGASGQGPNGSNGGSRGSGSNSGTRGNSGTSPSGTRGQGNNANTGNATGRDGSNIDGKPDTDGNADGRSGKDDKLPLHSGRNLSFDQKKQKQLEAEPIEIKFGDEANIEETIPVALNSQKEDVMKAEKALFGEDNKKAVLFTNGTGTGKTSTALGIVKRFVKEGRQGENPKERRVLILTPKQSINNKFVNEGSWFNLPVHNLADTKDVGDGFNVVVTTHANFRENEEVQNQDWDMIIVDEADQLMQSQSGKQTRAVDALRIAGKHHSRTKRIAESRVGSPELQRLNEEVELSEKAIQDMTNSRQMDFSSLTSLRNRLDELKRLRDAERKRYDELIKKEAAKLEQQTKVVFMSATPFASVPSLDYAEGFLYQYPKDKNGQRSHSAFMAQNFGWQYNDWGKLKNKSAGAEVDTGYLERQFHEKLKSEGVLFTRQLDSEFDYSRNFVLFTEPEGELGIGRMIDEGISILRSDDFKLYRLVEAKFNFLYTMRLLEAYKAKQIVPLVERLLKDGKKIVIFHNYNQGLPSHPFDFTEEDYAKAAGSGDNARAIIAQMKSKVALFNEKYPKFRAMDMKGLINPIETISAAFGSQVLQFNGTVSKNNRKNGLVQFNEGTDKNIIIVQKEAGKAGIDLHDQLGNAQRVEINLGLPIMSNDAIQPEGRIFRVGNLSDAVFLYPVIHANFERFIWSDKSAPRSGTAENFALGNEARGLEISFKDGYINAITIDEFNTKLDNKDYGKGGKEADKQLNSISPFDLARQHYALRQKRSRNSEPEGVDYFPTPEPLGFKMVEWADIRPGQDALEPSAGAGSISRYIPEYANTDIIEPSDNLRSQAAMFGHKNTNHFGDKFEELSINNKYDRIVMNPPFGFAGKTAMDHLAKAFQHLKDGGRVVALVPQGKMDDRLREFLYGKDAPEDAVLRAVIKLPAVTFEKAGTNVNTQIVIIDRIKDKNLRESVQALGGSNMGAPNTMLQSIPTIKELFDNIEDMGVPLSVDVTAQQGQKPSLPSAPTGSIEVVKNYHAKEKRDNWVAKINGYAGKDRYKELSDKAKEFGGSWSSYNKLGAIPGFQFKTEDAANRFASWANGGPQLQAGTNDLPLTTEEVEFRDNLTQALTDSFEGVVDEVVVAPSQSWGIPIVGPQNQVEAYHGGPYRFNKFTTDAIGTGEGAQAFGWGLYFTELESIARHYAEKLAPTPLKINGKNIDDYLYSEDVDADNIDFTIIYDAKTKGEALDIIDKEIKTKEALIEEIDDFINEGDNSRTSIANAISRKLDVEKRLQDLYDFYNAIYRSKSYELNDKNRNLYKATLHKGKTPDQYTWLEWDKPLNKKQQQIIEKSGILSQKETLSQEEIDRVVEQDGKWKISGVYGSSFKTKEAALSGLRNILQKPIKSAKDFYGEGLYKSLSTILGSDKEASLWLLSQGIDGIKYPAESISRGATSDTARGFNYVVFDENAVSIEEVIKFQKPSTGEVMGAFWNDKVYLDPRVARPETPIHEFFHAFDKLLTQYRPDILERGLELVADSEYYTEVKNNPAYANLSERDVRREALARAVAAKGVAMAANEKKGFAEWLKDFWKAIKDLVGIDRVSAKELSEMNLDQYSQAVIRTMFDKEALASIKNDQLAKNISVSWYSRLNYAIEKKGSTQTGAQWLVWADARANEGMIDREEMYWTGLEDWLDEKKFEKITKPEILKFLEDNKIEIAEKVFSESDAKKSGNSNMEIFETARLVLAEEGIYASVDMDGQSVIFSTDNTDFIEDVEAFKIKVEEVRELSTKLRNGNGTPEDYNNLKSAVKELDVDYDYSEFNDLVPVFMRETGTQESFSDLVVSSYKVLGALLDISMLPNLDSDVKGEEEDGEINLTRLQYTSSNLENKKEIVLYADKQSISERNEKKEKLGIEKDYAPIIMPFKSLDEIHFGTVTGGRALVWLRFGDTFTDDGRKVMVIDEIQSNRAEAIRDQGVKTRVYYVFNDLTNIQVSAHWENKGELEKEYEKELQEPGAKIMETDSSRGVPNMPFKKTYTDLAVKRALMFAVENGYDAVAWNTGEQVSQRFRISSVVDTIQYNYFKTYDNYFITGTYNNKEVFFETNASFDRVKDLLGSEIANKIKNGEGKEYSTGLKEIKVDEQTIGSEPMKKYYGSVKEGRIGDVGKAFEKYAKKYDKGARVEPVSPSVESRTGYQKDVFVEGMSIPITEGMKMGMQEFGVPLMQVETAKQKAFNELKKEWDKAKQIGITPNQNDPAGLALLAKSIRYLFEASKEGAVNLVKLAQELGGNSIEWLRKAQIRLKNFTKLKPGSLAINVFTPKTSTSFVRAVNAASLMDAENIYEFRQNMAALSAATDDKELQKAFQALSDMATMDLKGAKQFVSEVSEKPSHQIVVDRNGVPHYVYNEKSSANPLTLEHFSISSRVKKALNDLGVPIREKYIPRALGVYFVNQKIIGTRSLLEVFTAIHEGMHHIDFTSNITDKIMNSGNSALKEELKNIYQTYYAGAKATHPTRLQIIEGLAVLMNEYLGDPVKMHRDYPNAVDAVIRIGGAYNVPLINQLLAAMENIVADASKVNPIYRTGLRLADMQDVIRKAASTREHTWAPYTPTMLGGGSIGMKRYAALQVDTSAILEELDQLADTAYSDDSVAKMHFLIQQAAQISQAWLNRGGGHVAIMQSNGNYKYDNVSVSDIVKELDRIAKNKGWDSEYARELFNQYLINRRAKGDFQRMVDAKNAYDLYMANFPDPDLMSDIQKTIAAGLFEEFAKWRSIVNNDNFDMRDVNNAIAAFENTFKDATAIFDRINKNLLEFSRNTGLVSEKAYREWSQNKDYASFQRFFQDDLAGGNNFGQAGMGQFKLRKGSAGATFLGSMEAMILQIPKTIIKGYNNMFWMRFLEFVQKHGEDFGISQNQLNQEFIRVPKTGPMINGKPDFTRLRANPNYISFYINGSEQFYETSDWIRTMATTLSPESYNETILKIGLAASGVFGQMTTSANPFFAIPNLAVDQISSLINSKTGKVVPLVSELYEIAKEWKALFRIMGLKMGDPLALENLEKYLALAGDKQTLAASWNKETTLGEVIERAMPKRTAKYKALKTTKIALDILSAPVNLAEILTRFGEFNRALDKGMDESTALYLSAHVSAPFYKKGMYGGKYGRVSVKLNSYWNASTVAVLKTLKSIKEDKIKSGAVIGGLTLIAATSAASVFMGLGGDDEEKRAAEKGIADMANRSAEEFGKYIFLWNGKNWISIRVPEPITAVTGTAQMYAFSTAYQMNLDKKMDYRLKDYFTPLEEGLPGAIKSVYGLGKSGVTLDPDLAGATILQSLGNVIEPMASVTINRKTWPKLSPIVNMSMERLDPKYQFDRYTSGFAKYIGEEFNVSPMKVDYFLKAQFGSNARFLLNQTSDSPRPLGSYIWRHAPDNLWQRGREFGLFMQQLQAIEKHKNSIPASLKAKGVDFSKLEIAFNDDHLTPKDFVKADNFKDFKRLYPQYAQEVKDTYSAYTQSKGMSELSDMVEDLANKNLMSDNLKLQWFQTMYQFNRDLAGSKDAAKNFAIELKKIKGVDRNEIDKINHALNKIVESDKK